MKRFTYALALGLGLMMNACGSSGSGNSAAQSTCTNIYGQTVNGTMVNGVCQQTANNCTPCAGGFINPQNPGQCLPTQYAAQYGCGTQGGYYGGGYYGGGYPGGYYYPQYPYYGGGYGRPYPVYYPGYYY